ncbi:MAG: hypothetical protein AABY84_06635 [Candidatus Firestonebacteria bacterium]
MNIITILLVLIPIITAIMSSYLTYYFTIKSKKDESVLKFKEEKYSNLLIFLQGFVGRTISGETKIKFFEEQYKSWLYSSDGVVNAINQLIRLLVDANVKGKNVDQEEGKKISEILFLKCVKIC